MIYFSRADENYAVGYIDKVQEIEQYQVEEEQDTVANADDEELDKELERILKEKERRRKRQKDFEM